MTLSAESRIANLLYLYAERMDAGDLDGAADLFRHARVHVADRDDTVDHRALRQIWSAWVRIHPCGTPRTKHIITNPIIDFGADGRTASCRSCYTVLQAAEDFPLQIIAAGRYHDRFERTAGEWHFVYRDYRLLDLTGNMHAHLLLPLGG